MNIASVRCRLEISDSQWCEILAKARELFVKFDCKRWCRVRHGWQSVPEEIKAKAYKEVRFYLTLYSNQCSIDGRLLVSRRI